MLWCVQVFDKDEDVDKKATLKLARDTKNPTAFEKERDLGTYRTTQSMAFAPPPEVCMLLLFETPMSLGQESICDTICTSKLMHMPHHFPQNIGITVVNAEAVAPVSN